MNFYSHNNIDELNNLINYNLFLVCFLVSSCDLENSNNQFLLAEKTLTIVVRLPRGSKIKSNFALFLKTAQFC